MNVEYQPSYVLHRRPYRNSSALLDIICPEFGRVTLVARGARAQRSRFGTRFEPFAPQLLSWSGRGELGSVRRAEVVGTTTRLRGVRLVTGLYLNELLVRLLPRDEAQPELFACYQQSLERLAIDSSPEPALRQFEKTLLECLGYALELERDAAGQPIEANARYRYFPAHGASRVDSDPSDGEGVMLSGDTLLALAAERFDSDGHLREMKRLTRAALDFVLEGRPLVSRRIFEQGILRDTVSSTAKQGTRPDR